MSKCEAHRLLPSNSKVKRERIRLPELEQKHNDNFVITFKILRMLTVLNSGPKKIGYAPLLGNTE